MMGFVAKIIYPNSDNPALTYSKWVLQDSLRQLAILSELLTKFFTRIKMFPSLIIFAKLTEKSTAKNAARDNF